METSIMRFEFQQHPIRMVLIDGTPWFVAKDVAEILTYSNPQKAVRDHCRHHRPAGVNAAFTLDPQTLIIPEQDVYRLVLRSKLPEAEQFQDWLVGEVLPSIRRSGMYVIPGTAVYQIPKSLSEALYLAAKQAEQIEQHQATIQLMTPKAEFHDRVAGAGDGQSVREVAKVLGTGQNRLFGWLKAERILMSDKTPYQEYLDAGYFRVIEQVWSDSYGKEHTATKTLVTGRGLIWLQKRFGRTG